MDNLEIGRWLLNVSRVSHLQFVLLIHMLISGVVIKMFHLGRGVGKAWSKITYRPTHTPLFFTQGYAREKIEEGGGRKQTEKIINQFDRKSGPAIILVSNK